MTTAGLATDYPLDIGITEQVLASTVTFTPLSGVPEPSSLLMLGTGLLGLLGMGHKKRL